ncbi:type II toxin-antitoxin system RelE/ParE family toxin [Algoriphagus sp. H41]|uniref:Type II toxin-antitoxin system RelE/ParE family toxin n=1 Tax=Algoriphagus oliviformis TaxID=2811231 RepID=A0ABS3C7V6_9BACT|nr:type II toxin-antitoxin system RelE/ParE family toxin [Algoriphagus oliviformis]
MFFFLRFRASLETATKVRDRIVREVRSLVPFPQKGSLEPCLENFEGEFRFKIVWSYKIIYEVKEDRINVLDIFHTSRNPSDIQNK